MIRTATALMTVCFFVNGCVYYNSIYNAEQAYDQAEAHRRAGRDSLATASYQDVIRKAAEGYRRDPEGQWAPDALFLLGRARLRMGETGAAQAAFEAAESLAEEPGDSLAILVYRAVAAEQIGDREGALRLVNRALGGLPSGPALADGHLLRGRISTGRRSKRRRVVGSRSCAGHRRWDSGRGRVGPLTMGRRTRRTEASERGTYSTPEFERGGVQPRFRGSARARGRAPVGPVGRG